jgi:hypothetical protein
VAIMSSVIESSPAEPGDSARCFCGLLVASVLLWGVSCPISTGRWTRCVPSVPGGPGGGGRAGGPLCERKEHEILLVLLDVTAVGAYMRHTERRRAGAPRCVVSSPCRARPLRSPNEAAPAPPTPTVPPTACPTGA